MKKILSLLSTLTIGSTAIPAGYAMYPYNLENNSKLSGEWNSGEKSFDWKNNYLTTNVGKPKLSFNFVENSWWNKKNHQYDNLKNNFV